MFVATKYFCGDKSFVATKDVLCRDKSKLVATKHVCRDKCWWRETGREMRKQGITRLCVCGGGGGGGGERGVRVCACVDAAEEEEG